MSSKSRRSGGPKSPTGIAKSSQNSLKHGLTSNAPSSVMEKEMMDDFVKELEDYYQPNSPLEKLQIQRIALCRAKLARLYEIERARLEIEINKLAHSPDHFFESMPMVRGVVKGMVHEYIRYGVLTLPMGLTEVDLFKIVTEVRAFQGQSYDEPALWRAAPHLAQFVERHRGKDSDDLEDSRLAHLETILRGLDTIVDAGEHYMEHVKAIYAIFEPILKDPEEELTDSEKELFDMVQEQQKELEREHAKRHARAKPKVITEEEARSVSRKKVASLMNKCQVLVRLYFDSQEAKRIFAHYQETQSMLMKAVTLPSSESELFMRYQTNLERRLSLAIGELLELRRRG